jgi:hypothetical protein
MYVTLADTPRLNMKYVVFGKVISGMEVVDKLRVRRSDRQSNRARGKVATIPARSGKRSTSSAGMRALIGSSSIFFKRHGVGDRLRGEVVVQEQVGLFDHRRARRAPCRRSVQLLGRIEIVVAILGFGVIPPLLRVAAMQPQVIQIGRRALEILSNRRGKLRLVDLHPGGAMFVEQLRGLAAIAPRSMPQLDGERIAGERLQQPRDVVDGLLRALKAGGNWISSGPSLPAAASGSMPPLNASTSACVTGPDRSPCSGA